MIWRWLSSFRKANPDEETPLSQDRHRTRMPGLWGHRIPDRCATGRAGPKDLPRTVQEMFWQRPAGPRAQLIRRVPCNEAVCRCVITARTEGYGSRRAQAAEAANGSSAIEVCSNRRMSALANLFLRLNGGGCT